MKTGLVPDWGGLLAAERGIERTRRGMEKKTFALVVAIAALAVIAAYTILGSVKVTREYVCPDGRVVVDPDECVTSTTTAESTTTTSAATETSMTTTRAVSALTTATTFACSSAADCGVGVNSTPYCSGSYVKTDVMKPVCINPRSGNARCALTPTGVSNVIRSCVELREFCSEGMCIPRTCANGKHDVDEVEIDCGGVCPEACDEFSVLCREDSDCGEMYCPKDYFCLETNPAYTCYFKQCVNNGTTEARCVDANRTVVNEVCGRSRHCEPGRGVCIEGGTCSDCIRNQDETKVDCGGSCMPCAVIPGNYSTLYLSGGNDFKDYYTDRYGKAYIFVLNKVRFENRCPHGINLRIDNVVDGSVIASGNLDIYANATFLKQEKEKYKFHVGLLNVSTSSAAIWIVEPE